MVEIRSNPSFAGWFEVAYEGTVIQEVQGRKKALRLAKEVALKNKEQHILCDGKIIEVEDC